MHSRLRLSHAIVVVLALSDVAVANAGDLQQMLRTIGADAHGKVAIACELPGVVLDCDLHADAKPPMQSVFKVPLAMTVLDRIEQGALSLDHTVRFQPDDRILPRTYSPLQDEYPDGNVDVSVRELLRLAVALSDNVAADVLLRIIGGPAVVNRYIASLGIAGFHLQDGEHAMHRNQIVQYRNWLSPSGAVRLLRRISDSSPLSADHTALLLQWMRGSVKGRLAAGLPSGTAVFHKAGTSGVDAGIAHATNDIGLVTLPDGRRLAIAVFITDATADAATRDTVISRIGRVLYDAAVQSAQSGRRGRAPSSRKRSAW